MGVQGGQLPIQVLVDQLTLFQPEGTDYAHLITTGTPGFADLPTALRSPKVMDSNKKRLHWASVLRG